MGTVTPTAPKKPEPQVRTQLANRWILYYDRSARGEGQSSSTHSERIGSHSTAMAALASASAVSLGALPRATALSRQQVSHPRPATNARGRISILKLRS